MTLTKSDAELVFRYFPDQIRNDVEFDAYDRTLEEWQDEQPDDLKRLEAAHEDDDSPFEWDHYQLTFEQSQVDGDDELVPHTMAGGATDEIYDAARDFGWDWVDNVRERVREMQEETAFSPREFVAFVLSKSHLTYAEAAVEMDITHGTYSSKMSREVKPVVREARATVGFVKQFEE